MKAQANVNLHNRFDIEVRDAITGELKQSVKAFNIVLDAMWTRLCGGSSYFVNIHFGTGTGTLAPTRTSLFTHLGTKTAVDDTLVKAIPNSSWKRKIVLNPEEYVGSTLSEVGIAYGSTTSNLVTHAMLEDSEGNPITITKTDTDIVTIYATIFVTFGPDTDDFKLIRLPNNNTLVNYLIGGGAAPSGTIRLGSGGSVGAVTDGGCESAELGATSSVTWTTDTANKRRSINVARIGTTVGNGHVQEFVFENLFRSKLPSQGLYIGMSCIGIPIGTGDGVTREFMLPSKNVRLSSIDMKLNGVSEPLFDKTLICQTPNFSYSNPNVLTSQFTYGIGISGDENYIAVAGYGTPRLLVYKKIGSGWISVPLSQNIPDTGYGCSFSSEGTILAVSHSSSPRISIYDLIDGVFVYRNSTPPSIPNAAIKQCVLSSDGSTLLLTSSGAPYVHVWDWSGSAWVARTAPPNTGSGTGNAAMSHDGLIIAVPNTSSMRVYTWNGNAWSERPSISGYGVSAALSFNGSVLAMSDFNSPYIRVFDWNDSSWVARPTPPNSGSYGDGIALSSDGNRLVHTAGVSPFIRHYTWNGIAWENYASWNLQSNNVDISSAGNIFAAALSSSPYIGIYDIKAKETKITFNTAPAAGVAITADYTVDGVHKTDQYVIDVGFSIQFGEPV